VFLLLLLLMLLLLLLFVIGAPPLLLLPLPLPRPLSSLLPSSPSHSPSPFIRSYFGLKQLEDSLGPLSDYNIQKASTLHVVRWQPCAGSIWACCPPPREPVPPPPSASYLSVRYFSSATTTTLMGSGTLILLGHPVRVAVAVVAAAAVSCRWCRTSVVAAQAPVVKASTEAAVAVPVSEASATEVPAAQASAKATVEAPAAEASAVEVPAVEASVELAAVVPAVAAPAANSTSREHHQPLWMWWQQRLQRQRRPQ
jgi:hypothetical protein